MNKILKKVQLSTEQSTPMSADPTKGTAENPYSQVEMATLQEEGTWNGGYVEGMGYIVPMMMGLNSDSDPHELWIKEGKGNTQVIKIDNHTEFSISFTFSWEEGLARVLPVSVHLNIPDSPIYAEDRKYKYEIIENSKVTGTVEWQVPGSYPGSLDNSFLRVSFSFNYNKTEYDPKTHRPKKSYLNVPFSDTFQLNISEDLYWKKVY